MACSVLLQVRLAVGPGMLLFRGGGPLVLRVPMLKSVGGCVRKVLTSSAMIGMIVSSPKFLC